MALRKEKNRSELLQVSKGRGFGDACSSSLIDQGAILMRTLFHTKRIDRCPERMSLAKSQ